MIDHTLNTIDGSLFAIDLSEKSEKAEHHIDANFLYYEKQTKGACVQFWYFMDGLNSNETLKLNADLTNDYNFENLWYASGNQGPFWHVHR